MNKRCERILAAILLSIGLGAWAAPPAAAATDLAADLEQRRQRIVRDYVEWSRELAAQHGIDAGATVDLSDSAAPAAQIVSYLQRLARLRATEALELGIEHIELTAEGPQGVSRPGVDLLVAIGRPASRVLAERLRADPATPEAMREALRRIERETADTLLPRGAPSPPAPEPALAPIAAGSLEIRYLQLPGVPLPEYTGHGTQTVLDLASGERREGPSFADTPLDRASLATAVDAIQAMGDLALIGEFMIVSSGRHARFKTGDFESLAGRDLSSFVLDGDATAILEKETIWLLQTLEGQYALVQYFGTFDGEALLAYVVQPDGSARFPLAPLTSPAAFRARPGVTTAEMTAHGLLIHRREAEYWKRFAAELERLDGPASAGPAARDGQARGR